MGLSSNASRAVQWPGWRVTDFYPFRSCLEGCILGTVHIVNAFSPHPPDRVLLYCPSLASITSSSPSLSPEHWDYRHMPQQPACFVAFHIHFINQQFFSQVPTVWIWSKLLITSQLLFSDYKNTLICRMITITALVLAKFGVQPSIEHWLSNIHAKDYCIDGVVVRITFAVLKHHNQSNLVGKRDNWTFVHLTHQHNTL